MRIQNFDIYFDVDPDPDPSFQSKAQTLEEMLKQAHIPYIFACKLMRIWFRSILSLWCGYGFLFDADADPDVDLGY